MNSTGKSHLLYLFVFLLIFSSCREDEIVEPKPQINEINEFIWKNMSEYYLWEKHLPGNIDRSTENDSKLYFEKLLYKPTDKWSFITDNYDALMNLLKGVEKSFGHHFKLFVLQNSTDVVGVVKYVIPDSPADEKGIKRGDVFFKVNGQTMNTANYRGLLFDRDSYTLSFGKFDESGRITPTEDKTLISGIISENPIHIRKTIDIEGNRIGYLSYNQFIADYNDELVNAFKQFKNDGITDLVLDLRYNPGGSIHTAVLLSSMIAPAAAVQNGEIFIKMIWNDKINDYFLKEEGENSDNLVARFIQPEVNLDLQKVYILITSNSASASELVINCLDPYMEVILVGPENTTGKYVGSITIQDKDANHNWALQPIVLKTVNASGISDYDRGLAPHFTIDDDFNAGLGTIKEDMLAKSVELITGKSISGQARTSKDKWPELGPSIANQYIIQKQKMFLE
ncbi:MAG: S41 family peptidase [Cytophagales bacterium]|nr:S41 family peptidase [Cytophagales bacterium]